MDGGLGRLHRIVLVMNRRGRAGEIVDLIDLDIERKGHVMAHEFEARIAVEMVDVAPRAGEQIVRAQHLMPLAEQPVDQVRSDEPGSSRYQDAFAAIIESRQAGDLPERIVGAFFNT